MTQKEADKIAKIIATADSGCSSCVNSLCERLTKAEFGFRFEKGGPEIFEPYDNEDPEFGNRYDGVIAIKL